MSSRSLARLILAIAVLYDGILGALFLFAAPPVFSLCSIPVPNHWGYVHFAAALLLIFALMFLAAAVHPAGNRNLIAFGMLLKLAYVGVVLYHWTHGDVPAVFKIFLVLDALWFVLLAWVLFAVREPAPQRVSASPAP